MSVRLVPEVLAATPPPAIERPATLRADTRPIEPSDKANAKGTEQQQTGSGRNAAPIDKAEPSARPPGTDPSQPPQTLFDASLISAGFRPATTSEDIAALSQKPDLPDSAPRQDQQSDAGTTGSALSDAFPSSQPLAFDDPSRQIDASQVSVYVRGTAGSPLSTPPVANPDWLTAIEKLA